MKTTLEIDDELYREAKAHASLTGQKMKDLVTEGLRLALRTSAERTDRATTTASRDLTSCDNEHLQRAGALTPDDWLLANPLP